MAFQISNGTTVPHATDYADLLNKVVTFAIGTSGWVIHNDQRGTVGEITLRGIDYSGTANIYVGIKKISNPGADIYGWILQGYTGFTNAGFSVNPGAIQNYAPCVPLWNDEIPYWCFVNPRRIIVIAKIASVYVGIYVGLMLPYGSAGQWQYPLVISGSNVSNFDNTSIPRYSDITDYMASPVMPLGNASYANMVIRTADGEWVRMFKGLGSLTPLDQTLYPSHGVSPYCDVYYYGSAIPGWQQCRPNLDGKYPLRALRVMRKDTPDALGILDGAKYAPGYNLSAEDTITEGSDVYVAFQDVFRTNLFSFFAIKKA